VSHRFLLHSACVCADVCRPHGQGGSRTGAAPSTGAAADGTAAASLPAAELQSAGDEISAILSNLGAARCPSSSGDGDSDVSRDAPSPTTMVRPRSPLSTRHASPPSHGISVSAAHYR